MKPFFATLFIGCVALMSLVFMAERQWGHIPAAVYPERALEQGEVWVRPRGLINERALRLIQLRQRAQPIDGIVMGNSRANFVSADFFNPRVRFYNLSIGGVSLLEIQALWRAYLEIRPPPKYLILFLDPKTFYSNSNQDSALTVQPGRSRRFNRGWMETLYYVQGLFSWDGVNIAIQTLRRDGRSAQRPMIIKQKDLPDRWTAYAADGSLLLPPSTQTPREIMDTAVSLMDQYPENYGSDDPKQAIQSSQRLSAFLTDVRRSGTSIFVIAPPYHPIVARRINYREPFRGHIQRFSQTARQIATSIDGVSYCDMWDQALQMGCSSAEFKDDIHAGKRCIQQTVNQCLSRSTLGNSLLAR